MTDLLPSLKSKTCIALDFSLSVLIHSILDSLNFQIFLINHLFQPFIVYKIRKIMSRYSKTRTGPKCSFCDNHQSKGIKIISGPKGVYICSGCIKLSREIIRNSNDQIQMGTREGLPTPKQIKI